ncbi:MAG: phosphate signaling complex protein PhoU [Anaerolineales bacterium]
MLRGAFDRNLRYLQDDVLALGSMVETFLFASIKVLKRQDREGARQLIADNRQVNDRRFAIEDDCLYLIATQQPMASDLRTLAAVLEIVRQLERIGDYAKGIGRITLMMDAEPVDHFPVEIPRMAEKTRDMLHRALDAFVYKDLELARAIPREDDVVDALYNKVYEDLLGVIVARPRRMNQASHLLWVAHNLERGADRVTNICERVIFSMTGQLVEMDVDDWAQNPMPTSFDRAEDNL